jgi:hypothetical protein
MACLFCDSQDYTVAYFQNGPTPTHTCVMTQFIVCSNGHLLQHRLYKKCILHNRTINCDPVITESQWIFADAVFPGRMSRLEVYNFKNQQWTFYSLLQLYRCHAGAVNANFALFKKYNQQQARLRKELQAASKAWLLCSLRIGRCLMNKDIRLYIARMLALKPFVFFKEEEEQEGGWCSVM